MKEMNIRAEINGEYQQNQYLVLWGMKEWNKVDNYARLVWEGK